MPTLPCNIESASVKRKDKRYIESRWGEFSCSGFGLIFPWEGMINANKYNTILSDYFHPLKSFSLVWVFFLQDDRVCTHRAREVTEQFNEPENNVILTLEPAQQQDLKDMNDLKGALRFISSHLLLRALSICADNLTYGHSEKKKCNKGWWIFRIYLVVVLYWILLLLLLAKHSCQLASLCYIPSLYKQTFLLPKMNKKRVEEFTQPQHPDAILKLEHVSQSAHKQISDCLKLEPHLMETKLLKHTNTHSC